MASLRMAMVCVDRPVRQSEYRPYDEADDYCPWIRWRPPHGSLLLHPVRRRCGVDRFRYDWQREPILVFSESVIPLPVPATLPGRLLPALPSRCSYPSPAMMRSRTLENLAKREEKKRETEEGRRNPITAWEAESPK